MPIHYIQGNASVTISHATNVTARGVALEALVQVLQFGRSLNDALAQPAARLTDPRERGLARELSFGIVRWLPRLTALLDQLLAKPLGIRDTDVRVAILMGLYQIIYTRIPPHAAVSESVRAIASRGKPWAKGLVNGVLRRFQREREQILDRIDGMDPAVTAHPEWLLEALKSAWPDDWRRIVTANNSQAPMTLRVNRRRINREGYLARLKEAGLNARPIAATKEGITLLNPVDVNALPGFEDGLVSVQDAAPQFAAGLLNLAPDLRVLDACAAPGGKTAHILEAQVDLGEVVAVDIDAYRIERLQANLKRLGLEATVVCGDGTKPNDWWDRTPFDRVLLDAPCSATGVIRRRPDVKIHRKPRDVEVLTALQERLLDSLWDLLTPGGRLLYATCSILPMENQNQVTRFLRAHEDAMESPIDAGWGTCMVHGRQVLPEEDGMDGFYYAILDKRP